MEQMVRVFRHMTYEETWHTHKMKERYNINA